MDDEQYAREQKPARDLDDRRDTDELRTRYDTLLQELRVLLPGVQILAAFLLTVPFATGFDALDGFGRDLYLVALAAAVLAVVAFITPTVLHRFGFRRERGLRLEASVIAMRLGLVGVLTAVLTGFALVARFVSGTTAALLVLGLAVVLMLTLWVAIPLVVRRRRPLER